MCQNNKKERTCAVSQPDLRDAGELEGETYVERTAGIALSFLSPPPPGFWQVLCFLFLTAIQDLDSLQLQLWLHEAEHWKVGEHTANWGTGEASMRPQTCLQELKCGPQWWNWSLNWSERETMSWCNSVIPALRLNSMNSIVWEEKNTNAHKHETQVSDKQLC